MAPPLADNHQSNGNYSSQSDYDSSYQNADAFFQGGHGGRPPRWWDETGGPDLAVSAECALDDSSLERSKCFNSQTVRPQDSTWDHRPTDGVVKTVEQRNHNRATCPVENDNQIEIKIDQHFVDPSLKHTNYSIAQKGVYTLHDNETEYDFSFEIDHNEYSPSAESPASKEDERDVADRNESFFVPTPKTVKFKDKDSAPICLVKIKKWVAFDSIDRC